ncbi:transposable element Tcb2 transposase [Trichonephila clavipes]|nr:transposable element Tcb2 transposase [Trichonephila clavipes]
MDDNARPHRTLAVEELLESEDITRMDWPAYSPDLNPIEHVGDALGRRIAARLHHPENTQQLKQMLIEEWALIPQEMLHQLVLSKKSKIRPQWHRQQKSKTHSKSARSQKLFLSKTCAESSCVLNRYEGRLIKRTINQSDSTNGRNSKRSLIPTASYANLLARDLDSRKRETAFRRDDLLLCKGNSYLKPDVGYVRLMVNRENLRIREDELCDWEGTRLEISIRRRILSGIVEVNNIGTDRAIRFREGSA